MIENFGLYLKHERELRGVPLEEIAGATKVHIRYLEALENNDFDELPGEVFIKGYIRSYARSIGFDAEEMINAYDESVGKNRKEEQQSGQADQKRTQSRNKNIAKFALLGLIVVGLIFAGKMAVELLLKQNETDQAKHSTAVTAPQTMDEATSADAAFPEEPESKEGLASTLPMEASPAGKKTAAEDNATLSEAKAGKPPARPSPPAENPKKPEPVIEKTPSAAAPDPKVEQIPPTQEKTEEPKSPVESQEKQKNSDSEEKEVIIQQVGENSEETETDPPASDAEKKALHLLIQVQGNSWFNLTADDGEEKDFILPGGTSKSFYADEGFRVTIGNRRGTKLFLNGESLDLPRGASDVIRDFKITANLTE